MNVFKKQFQFIKLSDVLNLLGKEFHLYEQPSYIGYSKMYEKDDEPRRENKRIYAQHITKLDIEETGYYKDLWFQMYIYTKDEQHYTIYDDNVSFAGKDIKDMKVSSNPYISPMFVMRDAMSYMRDEDKRLAEMIKMNERFLHWLHYMGIKDEELEKYYIQYEYNKEYSYDVPNIELDYQTREFKGYKDGKLKLSTYEIDEIVKDIKNPALRTKTDYLLRTLGSNKCQEREGYDYD